MEPLIKEWVADREEFHTAFVDFVTSYENFDGADREEAGWSELLAAFGHLSESLDRLRFVRSGLELRDDGRLLQAP